MKKAGKIFLWFFALIALAVLLNHWPEFWSKFRWVVWLAVLAIIGWLLSEKIEILANIAFGILFIGAAMGINIFFETWENREPPPPLVATPPAEPACLGSPRSLDMGEIFSPNGPVEIHFQDRFVWLPDGEDYTFVVVRRYGVAHFFSEECAADRQPSAASSLQEFLERGYLAISPE